MKNILLFHKERNSELENFLGFDLIGKNITITDLEDDKSFSHLHLSEKLEKLNPGSLKQELGKQRKKYQIISIEPLTAKISSLAARDGRVDAIIISSKSSIKVFNLRYARRLEENNKFIILDLSSLFGDFKASSIRPLLRIVNIFAKTQVPILLTSLGGKSRTYRPYRGLQSIARTLGLNNARTDPNVLLERIENNNKKIKGKIPFPGIEVEE